MAECGRVKSLNGGGLIEEPPAQIDPEELREPQLRLGRSSQPRSVCYVCRNWVVIELEQESIVWIYYAFLSYWPHRINVRIKSDNSNNKLCVNSLYSNPPCPTHTSLMLWCSNESYSVSP